MKQACDHCGQPLGEVVKDDDGHAFCCVGCRAVYHAIHSAGMSRFYDLKAGAEGPPAPVEFDEVDLGLLDDIHQNEDGTCEVDLHLDGVHCAGCVWIVEKMPQAIDGVVDARLNLSRARLTLRWQPEAVELDDMGRWLARFGYQVHRLNSKTARSSAEDALLLKLGVAWALAANVMLLAITLYSGLDVGLEAGLRTAALWLSLILTTISVFYAGQEFFRRAWASVWPWAGLHRLSVDVPISVGVFLGWSYSAWATIAGSAEVWFDSIAVLIAALLSARYLQLRGRRRATDSAERLLELIPSRALRVGPEGLEEVDTQTLAIGDIIEVRLGDVVPVDGEVTEGRAVVNRAAITGESRPELVVPGSLVNAGETVVGSVMRVRTMKAGGDTRVGKLLHWVESEAEHRAPVVQLADRIAGYFVLAVLFAAALTFGIWWSVAPELALAHTIALLVISCPCALGMATPLALTVGAGRAARRGIFIKHDDVLEELDRVQTVVFDKTGTLTQNQMRIVEIAGQADAIKAAVALEKHSAHPLAAAFRKENSELEASEIEEIAGSGIQGMVAGKFTRVGRPDWLGAPAEHVEKMVKMGLSPVAIEIDGRVVCTLGLGDPLRPESFGVIQKLKARGLKTVLLSGDHPEIVQSVAQTLGIDQALGAETPESKREFIARLRESGPVLMIGDGVNDAAALQEANVGVAVHGGSDLNLVAADIFLTRPGLDAVLTLVEGAEVVRKVVRRNLIGSLIYNVLGVSAAAAGLVNPLVAAIAMPVSSLSVVASSLLQRSFEPKEVPDVHSLPSSAPGADSGRVSGRGVRVGHP